MGANGSPMQLPKRLVLGAEQFGIDKCKVCQAGRGLNQQNRYGHSIWAPPRHPMQFDSVLYLDAALTVAKPPALKAVSTCSNSS